MSRFIKESMKNLKAYTPGEQPKDMEYIKLNTNESPYSPGPEVLKVIKEDVVKKLNLYPSPDQGELKAAVSDYLNKTLDLSFSLTSESIFVSNGSDDIINFAFMAFAGNGIKAVYPSISYGFYKVFAEFQDVEADEIPLKEDFSIDPRDYYPKDTLERRFIVIANPNAPTGIALSADEVEGIVKNNPESVVLIDEAYVDFGAESVIKLTDKYENLLVSRTFSKFASLAGARLGFAVGNKDLIEDLEKIKYATNPYSINRMTEAVGLAAISEIGYYIDNAETIANTREETKKALEELGFMVLPSRANFIFAGVGENAPQGSKWQGISGQDLYARLKEKGILVRWFSGDKIKDFLRITIGKPEDMEKLVEVLKKGMGI